MTPSIQSRSVRMPSNSLALSMANASPRLRAVLNFDLNHNVYH